jgi:hypothetical protein
MKSHYTTRVLLGILFLAASVAFSSAAENSPWKDKDWTQWTEQDCDKILTDSPWASQIEENFNLAIGGRAPGSTAVIISSLAVRQALVKSGKLDSSCLNESFADRIVVGFREPYLVKPPPFLIVSGKKIPPLSAQPAGSTMCNIATDGDVAYPRVLNGKPVFNPARTVSSSR